MQLYKNFFRILKSNKTGIIIYAVIMAVMIASLIFASSTGSVGDTAVKVGSDITYVDNDDSPVSRGLIEYLSVNNEVTDMKDKSESSIREIVFFNISDYHMTIPEGFGEGEGEIEYLTSLTTGSSTYYVDEQISSYMSAVRSYEAMGYDIEEASEKAVELMSRETSIQEVVEEKEVRTSDFTLFYTDQFFCYLVFGFLCLGVGHTVIANSDEKINNRIDTSPVGKKKISLVNTLGLITCGVVIWAVFMIINLVLGSGGPLMSDYWWAVALNLFVTMLFSCAMASLITSLPITPNVLTMVTNIVSLGMSFLCGVFVAQEFLGENVLKVAKFLPMYWSVLANNMINTSYSGVDFDLEKFLMCIGIQAVFAIAFATAGAFVKSSRIGRSAG